VLLLDLSKNTLAKFNLFIHVRTIQSHQPFQSTQHRQRHRDIDRENRKRKNHPPYEERFKAHFPPRRVSERPLCHKWRPTRYLISRSRKGTSYGRRPFMTITDSIPPSQFRFYTITTECTIAKASDLTDETFTISFYEIRPQSPKFGESRERSAQFTNPYRHTIRAIRSPYPLVS
jgi:hypothetical protein